MIRVSGGGVRAAAVVAAVVPGHGDRGAVGGDGPGVGVGLAQPEQGVPFALHQQGRRGDVADDRLRAGPVEQDRGEGGGDPAGLGGLRVGRRTARPSSGRSSPTAPPPRGVAGAGCRRACVPSVPLGRIGGRRRGWCCWCRRAGRSRCPRCRPGRRPVADSAAPVVTEAISVDAQNFLNTPSSTPLAAAGVGAARSAGGGLRVREQRLLQVVPGDQRHGRVDPRVGAGQHQRQRAAVRAAGDADPRVAGRRPARPRAARRASRRWPWRRGSRSPANPGRSGRWRRRNRGPSRRARRNRPGPSARASAATDCFEPPNPCAMITAGAGVWAGRYSVASSCDRIVDTRDRRAR